MLFNLLDHASLLPKHPRPLWRDRENLLQFGLIKVSDQKHDLQKSDQKLLLRTFAALAVSYKLMTLTLKVYATSSASASISRTFYSCFTRSIPNGLSDFLGTKCRCRKLLSFIPMAALGTCGKKGKKRIRISTARKVLTTKFCQKVFRSVRASV